MHDTSSFQKLLKKEREERKNLIIDAAVGLLSQTEIHDIKMRDIAKWAGISVSVVCNYFPRRDDIFVEVLMRHIKEMEELFEKNIKAGRTSLEELSLTGVDYLLENNSVFQLMVLMITGQFQPKDFGRYNEMQRRFFSILEQAGKIVDIGIKSRLVTHAIYASMLGVILVFKNYPGRSPEEIRLHIYRLVQIIARLFAMPQIPREKDMARIEKVPK